MALQIINAGPSPEETAREIEAQRASDEALAEWRV